MVGPDEFDAWDDEDEKTATRRVAPPQPPAKQHSLVVVHVPDAPELATELGRRIPIDKPVTIGRHPANVLRLDHTEISRRHAEVRLENGQPVVRDLGSSNGTLVNHERIGDAPWTLSDGDQLFLGEVILKYVQSATESEFHEVVYRMKVEDALTGAHNKRYLLEFLDREIARAQRHRAPLSLVLFDLDHFKRVNDGFGHQAGDLVLRKLADTVKASVRKEECFARYGGEEFALVQPDTTAAQAALAAERIRGHVESAVFAWNGVRIPVTLSVGVAQLPEHEGTLQRLIALADERLYEAKRAGRNRVVAA